MEKKSTDKLNVQLIAKLCAMKGVGHAVISPGSRNTPLMVAFNREPDIKCHVIVDERSAGFFALGLAQQKNQPVVLVCTSGTALLNYSPAVAEAYYQRIPLIIISADRPTVWIDQDDSQTIRQYKILDPIVKYSYQIEVEDNSSDRRWTVERTINDAYNLADSPRKGPVHINVPLKEPLFGEAPLITDKPKVICKAESVRMLSDLELAEKSKKISQTKKVMIFASMHRGGETLEKVLLQLSRYSNIVVMTETVANIKGEGFISCVDRTLCRISKERKTEYTPDLLISYGGPVISKLFKEYIREHKVKEHWLIGEESNIIDTFCNITQQVNIDPEMFFMQLAQQVRPFDSTFSQRWQRLNEFADKVHNQYVENIGWSELKAFSIISPRIPKGSHLQLSNGMTVRYHQLIKNCKAGRVNSNRGVSGIDGSTSTAAGAAKVFNNFTTLITGDLSFLYDINGLWNFRLSHHLRIIVMNNGGGGIFRFIKGPSSLPEMRSCFEAPHNLDLSKIADLYGLNYVCAQNAEQLETAMRQIYAWKRATLLDVMVPASESADILRGYFTEKMK